MASTLPEDAFMSEAELAARDEAFAGRISAFRRDEGKKRAAAAQARARAAEEAQRVKEGLAQPSWKLEMEAEMEAVKPRARKPRQMGKSKPKGALWDDAAIADAVDAAEAYEEDSDEEGVAHVVVSGTAAVFDSKPVAVPPEVEALKAKGASAAGKGEWEQALEAYSEALVPEATGEPREGLPPEYTATLHSNRALSYLKLGDARRAEADASAAAALWPEWPKPLHHLAAARLAQRKFGGAVKALRRGQQLALAAMHEHMARDFQPLLERISYEGALAGNYTAFDGRTLEVREAGEDAWKMDPAPYVPELDDPHEETSINALEDVERAETGAAAGALQGTGGDTLAKRSASALAKQKAQQQRYSYRCISEAIDAAEDGDRILLKAGIHNTGGQMVLMEKRVLIRGEGSLGSTKLDQRGNSPTFRCMGHFVVQNLHITHTGYRETIMCEAGRPIFENCVIKNDVDDGINVIGTGNPTFRHCYVGEVAKSAFVFFEGARGLITECMVRDNKGHGLRCVGKSAPTIRRCNIVNNGEEGVVATEEARPTVEECNVRANLGTGVDASREARPRVLGCVVKGNKGGGCFFWDDSRGQVEGCRVDGGESHALVVDGGAAPKVQASTFDGVCLVPQEVLDTRCKECVFNNPEDASKWIPSDKAYEPVGATVLARGFDQYYHT